MRIRFPLPAPCLSINGLRHKRSGMERFPNIFSCRIRPRLRAPTDVLWHLSTNSKAAEYLSGDGIGFSSPLSANSGNPDRYH
jgi:hypothetical protein